MSAAQPPTPKLGTRLVGVLIRRECWTLSRRAWLLITGLVCATFGLILFGAYPLLAVSDGGQGEVMVVEGWIGSRRIDLASDAFKRGKYQCVVVVRDVYEDGDKWSSGRYTADYVAAGLVEHGVPTNVVHTLFCPVVRKDRTYHCALAVRQWLEQRQLLVKSIDVATLAVHSRRSRLLYEKAFGGEYTIGAIALEDPTYDPARWWRSSAGVREVIGEGIAYIYARCFFWPGQPPPLSQVESNQVKPGQAKSR